MEFKNTALAEHTNTYLLDIETFPHKGYWWGNIWKPIITVDMIAEHGKMACFAGQWYGKKRVTFRSSHHHSREEMVQKIHDDLCKADIVIHFNGDSFDMKHLNREFMEMGLGPVSPYQSIDLLKTVRKQFTGFPTNKLQYVTRVLETEGKLQTGGAGLWIKCLEGDTKAWKTMKQYNMRDTTELVEVYDALIPWIHNHPNLGLYIDPETEEPTCPNCGSTHLHKRGKQVRATGLYQVYHCQNKTCGKYPAARIRALKTGSGVLK